MLLEIVSSFFENISKCSGAIKFIVSISTFLLVINIDKPKFFKLLDAIFFFGKFFSCCDKKKINFFNNFNIIS